MVVIIKLVNDEGRGIELFGTGNETAVSSIGLSVQIRHVFSFVRVIFIFLACLTILWILISWSQANKTFEEIFLNCEHFIKELGINYKDCKDSKEGSKDNRGKLWDNKI